MPTRKRRRGILTMIMLAMIIGLSLVGCGQTDPPTEDELKDNLTYFQVDRPDGTQMWCNMYGADTNFISNSKSWFAFSCDWGNQFRNDGQLPRTEDVTTTTY